METAEFAICVEVRPGELKPILAGDVLKCHLPNMLMAVSRLNDSVKVLRVVVNGHLVNTLEIRADSYQIRGVPAFEA